jgi:hypothetical protein
MRVLRLQITKKTLLIFAFISFSSCCRCPTTSSYMGNSNNAYSPPYYEHDNNYQFYSPPRYNHTPNNVYIDNDSYYNQYIPSVPNQDPFDYPVAR